MTTIENSIPSLAERSSGRALAWAVLGTAVVQVIAPVVTSNGPGSSPGDGSGPDLLITPVGWAFSIWGLIYALAIAQATAGLFVVWRRSGTVPVRQQFAQVVLYLGAALWIVMAGLDSSVATAGMLLVMFAAAAVLVLDVARRPAEPGWLAVLTRAAAGLYAGWVTAALFLNLSTALVDLDVVAADEVAWQLVVLAVATVALVVLVAATGGNLGYAAAALWALLGITVTGSTDATTSVVVGAVVSTLLLVAATAWASVRWGSDRRGRQAAAGEPGT